MNANLLDAVMAKIKTDRKHWFQNDWRRQIAKRPLRKIVQRNKEVLVVDCNTAFCFAGWAVQLGSEAKPRWASTDELWASKFDDKEDVLEDGTISAENRARRLLDLDYDQAEALFDGGNEIRDLERIVEAIKADDR